MNQRVKDVYLAMVLLQGVHSVEEYAFDFGEAFPPARALGQRFPGLARPGFVAFNGLLAALGLFGYFGWVRLERAGTRTVLVLAVLLEGYNAVAHTVWAFRRKGYNPGLATAPLFAPLAAYLVLRLRRGSVG